LELRDLIVTPLTIILVYGIALWIRPRVTDSITRKYFLPALTVRIIGALAVGFLYQFYYEGGDTFNFHTRGSRHIWEAFMDSPILGWKMLTANGEYVQGIYKYASNIPFFKDPSSYFVIRVAGIFDLITWSSYSATAVLFAVVSFYGAWMLFITFYTQSPHLQRWLAIAILFMPSVIFWGSGLFKDTLTLAAIGFLTYAFNNLFVKKQVSVPAIFLFMISFWILFSVKKYILLCFLPAALLWIYAARLARIKSLVLKTLIVPFILLMLVSSGYYAIVLIGKDDPRYSIDKIANTAQVTAYDIGFYTGRSAGSGYSLGELDGTFTNMVSKAPRAINVSLFRPYVWEVKNPLMLLSALESLALLALTLFVVGKSRIRFLKSWSDPTVLFCLVFSLTFAFAVGVSTFNFGTLSRYKIPLIPFYVLAMVYVLNYSNKDRKLDELEVME
jgi:hypothetical protein